MRMSKRKKENLLKQWIKLSMLGALALVIYATFFWERTPQVSDARPLKKQGEEILEAIYKAPKFRIAPKGASKVVSSKKGTTGKTNGVEKKEKKTEGSSLVYHTVKSGDSLWKLAKKYYRSGLKGDIIYQANKRRIHSKNNLPVGAKLVIPNVSSPSDEKTGSGKETKKERARLVAKVEKKKTVEKEIPSGSSEKTYKVQDDDTLTTIAIDVYGKAGHWIKIWKANKSKIPNPNRLRVGMILAIPK